MVPPTLYPFKWVGKVAGKGQACFQMWHHFLKRFRVEVLTKYLRHDWVPRPQWVLSAAHGGGPVLLGVLLTVLSCPAVFSRTTVRAPGHWGAPLARGKLTWGFKASDSERSVT